MKIFLLSILTMAILSGCGIYDQQAIRFECDKKGFVIIRIYKAKMVSKTENIVRDEFLTHESILNNDNFEIACKRTNNEKH